MRRIRKRTWAWALLLGTSVLFVGYFKVLTLGFYWISTSWHAEHWQGSSLWLPDYRVTIEGLAVQGLSRNASGLTYNTETGTLFTVINRPRQVAELTTDGRLLRLMELDGLRDPEGITHVRDDVYIISDERTHGMHWVRIGADTKRISVEGQPTLRLNIDAVHNNGFEGVSWDSAQNRLFVVKEKRPLRVLVIQGLDSLQGPDGFQLDISEWLSSRAAPLFMSDLSSVTLHETTGHLLLLSDESALLVEYAANGEPVSLMPLWRGFHGLQRKVPQPEGVAVGADGALYVLSEPNLFYRFERSNPQRESHP